MMTLNDVLFINMEYQFEEFFIAVIKCYKEWNIFKANQKANIRFLKRLIKSMSKKGIWR